eukprot:5048180-Pleurochrysis_carterae.AAC.2
MECLVRRDKHASVSSRSHKQRRRAHRQGRSKGGTKELRPYDACASANKGAWPVDNSAVNAEAETKRQWGASLQSEPRKERLWLANL